MLVVLVWISITYQAWSVDGVRDVAIYVYTLIIFIAAPGIIRWIYRIPTIKTEETVLTRGWGS